MEKILLIMEGQKADADVIDFGCYLALLSDSQLTGVIVEDIALALSSPAYRFSYFMETKRRTDNNIQMNTDLVMRYFSEQCRQRGVKSDIFSDKGTPVEEVIYESRFADALIIAPDMFLKNRKEAAPTSFVKQILAKSECPVIIAPQRFEAINEIVFCYDGSESALFAIKEFTHLFPKLKSMKLTVVQVCNSSISQACKGLVKARAYIESHYNQIHFRFLEGDVKSELFTYVLLKKSPFVIMGAYGRNALSNFFKKSASDTIIRMLDLPFFITHH